MTGPARLLLYAALTPVGVLVRLATDPMRRRAPRTTNWRAVPERPATLAEARRP